MTRFGYFLLAFSLLHAGVETSFRYREGVLQLSLMLLYPVWFGLLLASFARLPWHHRTRIGSIALVVWFVVAPFMGARVGVTLHDAVFRSRLSEYEAAVQVIQAGKTPPIIPRLAHQVTPHTDSTGNPEVFFFWGAGFPVKHTAFVYRLTDPRMDSKFIRAWPFIRSLTANWYVVKD